MSENQEANITSNEQLRQKVKEIQALIENTLANRNKIFNNNALKEEINEELIEAIIFQDSIEQYKTMINDIQNQLSGLSLVKIAKQEDVLIHWKNKLEPLQKENIILKQIKKRQAKSINSFENKFNSKSERVALTEKQKNLKQECKLIKDFNQSQLGMINKQQKTINTLIAHCELVKGNIQRQKRISERTETDNIARIPINSLELKANEGEIYAKNEEINYINQVKQQEGQLIKLDQELSILKIQIKQKEQEIRINQLKHKELTRLNNQNKKMMNQLTQSRDKSFNGKTMKTYKSFTKFTSCSPIEKRKLISKGRKTFNPLKRNVSKDDSVNENEKSEVFIDIENLKSDIQLAIKDNETDLLLFNQQKTNKEQKQIQIQTIDYPQENNIYKDQDDDINDIIEQNNPPNEEQGGNIVDFKQYNQYNSNYLNQYNQNNDEDNNIQEELPGQKRTELEIQRSFNNMYFQGESKNTRKPFGAFGFQKKEEIKTNKM